MTPSDAGVMPEHGAGAALVERVDSKRQQLRRDHGCCVSEIIARLNRCMCTLEAPLRPAARLGVLDEVLVPLVFGDALLLPKASELLFELFDARSYGGIIRKVWLQFFWSKR